MLETRVALAGLSVRKESGRTTAVVAAEAAAESEME